MNLLTFRTKLIISWGPLEVSEHVYCKGVANGVTMVFAPEDWSPGVFAGTEGCPVLIDDLPYKITYVDFDTRTIGISREVH